MFSGEHLINDDGTGEKNGLVAYWKKLAVVMFGCLCLFVFDVCERGVQVWPLTQFVSFLYAIFVKNINKIACRAKVSFFDQLSFLF